jgi:hypothetical protein
LPAPYNALHKSALKKSKLVSEGNLKEFSSELAERSLGPAAMQHPPSQKKSAEPENSQLHRLWTGSRLLGGPYKY